MDDVLGKVAELLSSAHTYQNSVWGICPFHTDSRPSLMVHTDRYECVACGARGTTPKLLEMLSGTSHFTQPLMDQVCSPFHKWLRKSSLSKLLEIAWKQNKERGGSMYLRNRNIPAKWQIKLGIGLIDNWITFPITDNSNHLVGAVSRIADTVKGIKYFVPNKQNPNLVYVPSWKLVQNTDTVFMTFGILDAVSVIIAGHAALSTTNGKRLNDVSSLNSIRKRIVLLPDKGEEEEAKGIASRLGWRGSVLKIRYPDDSKDPNDLLRYHPDYLQELLCLKHG